MSQDYICYEQKDNIEGFESSTPAGNYGANINTSNYTGRLGIKDSIWHGPIIQNVRNIETEQNCMEQCYNNLKCTRYVYNSSMKKCDLLSDDLGWKNIGGTAGYAGYIIRKSAPMITVPTGTFGNDFDTTNYTGKFGSIGTDWEGPAIQMLSNIQTETSCAEECYNNQNCAKYTWNNVVKRCFLKPDKMVQWYDKSTIPVDVAAVLTIDNSYAGYITRNLPVTTAPLTTAPLTTTKPVKDETIIPGVPNLYFYIGLGVVGFVILIIIIIMMLGSSRKRRYDDDY